jgi:hypothetical protein
MNAKEHTNLKKKKHHLLQTDRMTMQEDHRQINYMVNKVQDKLTEAANRSSSTSLKPNILIGKEFIRVPSFQFGEVFRPPCYLRRDDKAVKLFIEKYRITLPPPPSCWSELSNNS